MSDGLKIGAMEEAKAGSSLDSTDTCRLDKFWFLEVGLIAIPIIILPLFSINIGTFRNSKVYMVGCRDMTYDR